MNYTKCKVSNLVAGDNIMWRGKVCQVSERITSGVKIQEFKRKRIAVREFKSKWHTILNDMPDVDKVSI